MEYDKQFAVYGDTSRSNPDDPATRRMDNILHQTGRLQLNTYQAFVRNLMNPMSDLRSLLLVHTTGTGKTITALATATEYVRQYQPQQEQTSVSSIIVLGFTKDVFAKELLTHPEFDIVNVDEAKQLKELEQQMHQSPAQAEQYHKKRNQYLRRLSKREVKGIYQFYGYHQFANRIINMEDVQTMIRKHNGDSANVEVDVDPLLVKQWIASGDVRINTPFIAHLARSLFICDEIHNLYKNATLNTYGLAIQIVFNHFYKTLPVSDINYGAARALMLSATPLTSSPLEIIPIILLLSGEELVRDAIFQSSDGVEQITSAGTSKIRQAITGRISYVMDDNPSEYPASSFAGDRIEGIDFLRFVRSIPSGHQLDSIRHARASGSKSDVFNAEQRGITLIKDITLPATATDPHGVIVSKHIADLANLSADIAVHKAQDGSYRSNIFHQSQLTNYSCKYARLVQMCTEMKGPSFGKMFVYHPFVQGSGTDMITGLLLANGFVVHGDRPAATSICMHCDRVLKDHAEHTDHTFTPVQFIVITGSVSKMQSATRLNAFNQDVNVYGERIKMIIGSRAMRESHTLKACRHVIITHEPGSISELAQIIGRGVRKHAHALLPSEMRTVTIHILITDVVNIPDVTNDVAFNEAFSYKIKVLHYKQINIIERIMYDVSVDYLINFRFKLKETPPLLGEPNTLDINGYNKYEEILSNAYVDVRNGITPFGIHTNRFNIFYFEGEVRITMMIIKRILLHHQPAITLKQLCDVVRIPPFHVEYNTRLISDEAISMAVNKLAFRDAQFRMLTCNSESESSCESMIGRSHLKMTDALYDQTSILIDLSGREYNIVCIGDRMCVDSILVRRLASSIAQGDACLIDAYRNVQIPSLDQSIDLKNLATIWDTTIDIQEIISMIRRRIDKQDRNPKEKKKDSLNKLPIKTHSMLAEWAIKKAADRAVNQVQITPADQRVALYILKYYQLRRLVVTIHQLQHTRIYSRYKRYDYDTGASWTSDAAKPSLASLPIGHLINSDVRLYQPSDKTWLELTTVSIRSNIQPTVKHPYQFYIYEDRIAPDSLSVVLKIKFTNDPKAKGITMAFLQRPQLLKVGKDLGIDVSAIKHKADIIKKIEDQAWVVQSKLTEQRVIYRLLDSQL
jgi:DNA polymerase III delta prime subunit